MNKIQKVLRLTYDCGLSNRRIVSCLKLGLSTISELLTCFKQSQLGWPLPEGCSNTELTQALYHGKKTSRDKGMTNMLLWQEYQERAYTQFCEHFIRWFKIQKRSMRHLHVAGDKLLIYYRGQRFQVITPSTGEVREAEVLRATLGASNYTYVEGKSTEPNSIACRSRAQRVE